MGRGKYRTGKISDAPTAAKWEESILRHKFQGHKGAIWSFVFLHDGVHIVSGSEDGIMRKWNCHTGLLVGEQWKGGGGRIYALALSPDGKTIACGRNDGSVQRWTTDGKMIEGVWTGHGKAVRSLSWSPSGSHIASYDGTILIRNADSGVVEVGPIHTAQGNVRALAYSPSGERIASGGFNKTICIWNTKTGKLVVGPIEDMGAAVTSLVWSSDSTKLYSASDKFARVFDSDSGKLLHRFEHNSYLWSVALSPKHSNVLACVGRGGVVGLWDTESHQPLGRPFYQNGRGLLCHVSFSRDWRYIAYGGYNNEITLWMVKDILPLQLPAPTPLLVQRDRRNMAQQEIRPNSPSLSCLNADATGGDDFIEEAHDEPYNNFFRSSQKSLPLPSSGLHLTPLFSARRLLHAFSRRCPPADESVPTDRSKRGFFSRHTRSNASLELAPITPNQPVPKRKVGQGDGEQVDHHASAHNSLSATKDKGKQRYDGPAADPQSLPSDNPIPLIKLDSADNRNILAQLMRRQGKNSASVKIAPTIKRPEVVEVYAAHGFRRLIVMKRKRKTKSPEATYNIPLVAPNTSGSSPAGQLSQAPGAPLAVAHGGGSLSPHAVPVQAGMSSHAVGGNGSPVVTVIGGPHASPSHFVTNYHTSHDSDSRSSIEGSFNRFLDRICFPCGHYHEDS